MSNGYPTPKQYVDTLRHITEVLGVTEAEISDALHVSLPTVARWLQGKNLPHGAMRMPLMRFMERRNEK